MWEVEPPAKFAKGLGAWQELDFQKRLVGVGGGPFEGGCNFYIKNKLKSKMFNDKKSW